MTLEIRLLGPPGIEQGDATLPRVRGHKAWGLLAYLVSAQRPVVRQRLIDLLFGDADDPLGALRWNLSHLRRALGEGVELGGDPVRLTLPAGTTIDTELVTQGSWIEAVDVPGLGLELLAGMSFDSSAPFRFWLEGERRHLVGASAGVLKDAARSRLANGDAEAAVTDATRLVELDPLDENAHVLLILALRAAGADEKAADQARACESLLRRELDVDAGPALRAALDSPSLGASGTIDRPTVTARIEAGQSAIDAGALAAGLDTLRRATWEARTLGDQALLARALVTTGSALVHAAKGTDEEGATLLVEGADLAARLGDSSLASTATRELGYVAVLHGQYSRSLGWLDRARDLADGDGGQLAWVELVAGMAHTDLGHHAVARRHLDIAITAANDAADRQAASFALASLGRLQIVREEWDAAGTSLRASLQLADEEGWLAFRPYPDALLGEVHLARGAVDDASDAFDRAWAFGRQIGDPCWESLAQRGAGLVAIHRGDHERALELLGEAPRTCMRLPDSYRWIAAHAQAARNTAALDVAAPGAARWVDELEEFSSRNELRELQATAALQRVRLGQPGAREIAQALVDDVDNPALAARLAALT